MRRIIIGGALAVMAFGVSYFTPCGHANRAAMQNPVVEYETYDEAKQALGFAPLYIPRIAGWELYYVSVINGEVADLSYHRVGASEGTEIRLRTAAATAEKKDDVSGIYSNDWTKYEISPRVNQTEDMEAEICKLPGDKSYAVHWKTGGYLFSVMSNGLSRTEFLSLLEDALFDLSSHYYPVNKSAVTTQL